MSELESYHRVQLINMVGTVFDSELPEVLVSEIVKNERFLATRDFCLKVETLPPLRKFMWNGHEIGYFVRDRISCMISPKDRAWIELMKLISPKIKQKMEKYIKKFREPLMLSRYRFSTLHCFCTITNRLPEKGEQYFSVPVRNYLDNLIKGKLRSYSKKRDYELGQLRQISPKIAEEIDKLTKRN